jgi:hypothetical protein
LMLLYYCEKIKLKTGNIDKSDSYFHNTGS